jgi:hypothetical protein
VPKPSLETSDVSVVRDRFMQWVLLDCLQGRKRRGQPMPYIWGGRSEDGCDCSGLVTWGLKRLATYFQLPDWTASHNTGLLWQDLPPVALEAIRPGDLVFYGPKTAGQHAINHVMVWVTSGVVVGQAIGDRSTKQPTPGKHTVLRPLEYISGELAGFRSLPLP